MMRENLGADQALENSKSTETETRSKNGEEAFEKNCRPTYFRQDEDDSLKYYEKAGYHSPEDACGLIRNRTAFDVIAVFQVRITAKVSLERVEGLDIVDYHGDRAREYKYERDDAEESDTVKAVEKERSRWQHYFQGMVSE